MSKHWRTILGAVAIGALMPAWAVDRPAVTIAFDLNVPRWQGQFGARRDELQAKVAAAVAAWMSQQMGFADFGAGTGGPQRLVLHLDVAPDAGAHEFKETQLRLELAGAAAATPLVWRFRSDERYAEPTGGVDAFAQEVALRLVDVDKQALVRQVLSRVPIASEAALWKDPVGWVIPFRKTDLCMDFKSMLRIENMLPSGAGPVLKEFMARASGDFAPREAAHAPSALRGRLFTEPVPAQEGLADLGRARPDTVAVRAVYVTEYLPLQPCNKPVPPDRVDFRGAPR
jgi:hypothetical protein